MRKYSNWKPHMQRLPHDPSLSVEDVRNRTRQWWSARKHTDPRRHDPPPMSIFTPLSGPNEIRLLELLPGGPTCDIVCRLSIHSLEHTISFEAVSYVWGDPLPRRYITCNGQRIAIGTSLDWGLHQVRNVSSTRLLWIDALCINQADPDEKSRQIRLMQRIYSQAISVLVWLGPDEHDEADVIESLMSFFRSFHDKELREITPLHYLPELPENPENVAARSWTKANGAELDGPEWQPVSRLFARDWFDRIWIVQEAALARRTQAYLGTKTMDLDFVGSMSLCLVKFIEHHQEAVFDHVLSRAISSASAIWGSVLLRKMTGRLPYLHRMITKSFISSCTDPRDRVFGLLGITKEGKQLEETNTPELLRPDYAKSCLEVFRDTALYIISVSNEDDVENDVRMLHLWNLLELEGPEPSWPSWVPWWHDARRPCNGTVWVGDPNSLLPAYEAAQKTKLALQHPSPSTLCLRGVFVDKITTQIRIPVPEMANEESCWDGTRRRWMACCAMVSARHPVAQSPTRADLLCEFALAMTNFTDYMMDGHLLLYWDALEWFRTQEQRATTQLAAAGESEAAIQRYRDETQRPLPPPMSSNDESKVEPMPHLINWLHQRNKLTPELLNMRSYMKPDDQQAQIATVAAKYPQSHADARSQAQASRFQTALECAKFGHTAMVITEKGFIGLSSTYVQIDDVVCVFYGCPVPMILHPEKGHYRHRGFGHFPALMDGKAIDMRAQGLAEEKWFEIH